VHSDRFSILFASFVFIFIFFMANKLCCCFVLQLRTGARKATRLNGVENGASARPPSLSSASCHLDL